MHESHFSKILGRTDILALGFGTMAGWSWIMLATTWLTDAGFWGTVFAFLLGTLIILGVGAIYGELTAALPVTGGELTYAYRAMGGNAAWLVGWMMTFAYLGVAAWEGIALATAVDALFPIPEYLPLWDIAGYTVHLSWAVIGMLGAVVVLLLNLFGLRPAVIFQVMGTMVLLLLALLLFFGGITFGGEYNVGEGFRGSDGFIYVFLMIPSMMIGFDVIPQSVEEMNLSASGTGKMIVVCIVFTICWYLLIITGLAFGAPLEVRTSGALPAAAVMTYTFGDPAFGTFLIIGGILGILTSWNGFFLAGTRLIFAMGRAKMLPAFFGNVHRKYKTPWAATLLMGAVCIAAPLLGRNALTWFVDSSSFCALFTYCCVTVSFLILRVREPDLPRPFRLRRGILLGSTVALITVGYLILFVHDILTGSDSGQRILLVFLWFLLGTLLFLKSRLDHGIISGEEQELLIFGEKFARRDRGRMK